MSDDIYITTKDRKQYTLARHTFTDYQGREMALFDVTIRQDDGPLLSGLELRFLRDQHTITLDIDRALALRASLDQYIDERLFIRR